MAMVTREAGMKLMRLLPTQHFRKQWVPSQLVKSLAARHGLEW